MEQDVCSPYMPLRVDKKTLLSQLHLPPLKCIDGARCHEAEDPFYSYFVKFICQSLPHHLLRLAYKIVILCCLWHVNCFPQLI